MEQYIPKSALVAEIERLVNNYDRALDYEAALEDVRNFIDSIQEEPKKCMYTKDNYTDNDRKTLCDGCEEKCEYAQKEEPVSEDLEEASKEWLRPQLDKSYADYGEVKMMELTHFDGYAMLDAIEFGANWQKEKEYTCYEEAFEDGAKWKVENLWKTADGDDLPETDREVIALVQDYPDDKDHLRVAFAHRPNKYAKVWNSDLGEEQVVEIEGYDKGGWNIPNVKWWLDCSLPKEIEL